MLDRLSNEISRRLRSGDHASPSTLSLVLAVYDPPVDVLVEQLDAIAAQTTQRWECVVVDDGSTDDRILPVLAEWVAEDPVRRRLIPRETNGGIAAATNTGLDAATGDVLAIVDHDDVLAPDAVRSVLAHFADQPLHGVVYTDEQSIDSSGQFLARYDKPDWSPCRFLGQNYLNHFTAFRRSVMGDLRVRREFEPSQDFDFFLRVIESAEGQGLTVGHIARTLYSWRAIAGSVALDAAEKPEVALAATRCVEAAFERRLITATARPVHVDGAATPSVERVDPPSGAEVDIVAIEPTSTATGLNAAVARSTADVICFVDDPDAHDAAWAAPLADRALRPDVGAVGPRIVDDTGGVLLSAGRTVAPQLSDIFAGEPAHAVGPWGALLVDRETSAVAPVGLTIQRSLFESVGGFPPEPTLDAAAARLCGSLAAGGAATLWTPFVEMRVGGALGERGLLDPGIARVGSPTGPGRQVEQPDERFDIVGLQRRGRPDVPPFDRAHRLIRSGAIDLVTSDVFDTLVTRAVATPSDLFVVLGDLVDTPERVTPHVFARARRDAEVRARRRRAGERRRELRAAGADEITIGSDPQVMAPEVDLREIWSNMPDEWGDLDAMCELELDLEGRSLQPIRETVAVFDAAHAAGIPIVLVSDIYLTAAELTRVLTAAGVDMGHVTEVVTSCDHRLGKAQGLLARTVERRGIQVARTLHLGDNEIADLKTARDLGAHAAHVDIARDDRSVETVSAPLRAWSSQSGTDLGISAAVRAVLVGDEFGRNPAYQFGVATMGPMLAGFGRWVSATADALGAQHVHCMLREGATIAELMTATTPDGPVPVPLHVSRWVTMRAAVVDGTADELHVALSRRAGLTAGHVADAFDCDVESVRRTLGADRIRSADVDDACALLAADDEMRTAIVAGAAELRARVLRYLRARLHTGVGPLVVADVGWGGTIQEGLTRILRSGGIDDEVVGLYLAFSQAGEERIGRGAIMHSYLPNGFDDSDAAIHSRAIAHHADTVERVLTPAIGTLLDIDESGEPVCRDVSHDPVGPSLALAQRGVRDVVARLVDRTTGMGGLDDARWIHDLGVRSAFAAALAEVVVAPSGRIAVDLGGWSHDDVAGADRRSIADSTIADAVRFANVHDVAHLDPHGRRWVGGLAGDHNRALVAQLRARHHGLDVDELAPESDRGVARLAAFEVGSDLARIQQEGPARTLPDGWSMLHLHGDVDSLRSIRFDAGEFDALVDVAHFSVQLTTTGRFEQPARSVGLHDDGVVYVDGHPVDARCFVHRAGGHLLLGVDDELSTRVRHVEATVGFRCIVLDPDSPLLDAPLTTRVTGQARRVAGAVRRRR